MRIWIFALLIGLALTASIGCSHGQPSSVVPSVDVLTPQSIETTKGHVLWGAWELTIEPTTLEAQVEPIRDVQNHFNVASYVLPPSCTDCISTQVLDVDAAKHLFSVKIILRNPTKLTGYDVRGIVFVKGSQQLVNADNWTALFDIPGDLDRNPFEAFAKEAPSRTFAGGATYAAIYRIVLPVGQMSVKFAVDASVPTNCPEPYRLDIIKGIDFLADNGSYSDSIEVGVYDWQNDIVAVQLDLSALGAPSPVSLSMSGGTWKASVANTYGAAVGFYNCWLQAQSAGSPWIYEPVRIEVKAFGADRLPAVLDLMHTWNPSNKLSKSNMKYQGSDLNWIIADQPYASTRLPYYDGIHREPLKTVPYCSGLLDDIESQTDPPAMYNLLTIGSQQLGETFTATNFVYSQTSSPIADAMEALYTAIGSTLSGSDKSQIASDTAGLPLALQHITAAVLRSAAEGYAYRQTALSAYSAGDQGILFDNGKSLLNAENTYYLTIQASAEFDYGDMYRAAGPVTQALDQIRYLVLDYVNTSVTGWEWSTPIGKVKIGTSGNDTYASEAYLLILDPFGSDTYNCSAGANISLDNPFSICIDLNGNDTYNDQGANNFAQGAGRCGIGVLWDANGDDQYNNYRFCQGMGNFGVGILIDSGGDDHYTADGCSQGSGYYGIGVLIDEWGDDQYDCYQFSQGFGYVKGWGLAYDHEGNDKWTANDSNIIYPGPQTAEHNTSMSQGQGYGFRYDTTKIWMSGGQGILFDHSGDDTYSCGVFGQACAYWFGTGILADYGGTDTMRGIWYVQSGDAHYGTCFLISKGPENDTYRVSTNVSMGGGHDFSNAFFLEEGGNDTYTNIPEVGSGWPDISLGGGNECGTGVFVDYAGNDNYGNPQNNTMGSGSYSDGRSRGSWGVFLDLGGTDTFSPSKVGPVQNGTWSLMDIGAGGDFANGVVLWQ